MYKVRDTKPNPYFKAFLFEKNLKVGDEYQGYDYLFWIEDKWIEWCKETGINYDDPKSDKENTMFGEWLFNTVGLIN